MATTREEISVQRVRAELAAFEIRYGVSTERLEEAADVPASDLQRWESLRAADRVARYAEARRDAHPPGWAQLARMLARRLRRDLRGGLGRHA